MDSKLDVTKANAAEFKSVLMAKIKKCGVARFCRDHKIYRETVYKALNEETDPKLETVLTLVESLGLKLTLSDPDPAA